MYVRVRVYACPRATSGRPANALLQAHDSPARVRVLQRFDSLQRPQKKEAHDCSPIKILKVLKR